MGKRKNLMKGAGQGIFIVLAILLSSVLSWGDTRLMVDQATNGGLNETIWEAASPSPVNIYLNGTTTKPSLKSCGVPVIDWDSTLASNVGGWVIFGSDASGIMWNGTVTCASYNPAVAPCYFTLLSNGTLPTDCSTSGSTLSSSTCLVSNAPLSTAVVANTVNGVCATPPNGATLTNAPTAGPSLCTVSGTGTSGAVITTANGYAWTCPGSGSPTGLTANCYAYLSGPSVSGACGPDNGQTYSSLTSSTSGLCNPGTVTSFTDNSTTTSGAVRWTWSCVGSNGGSTATGCSAKYGTTAVAGQCGSANGGTYSSLTSTSSGLCSPGSVINFAGTGPWTWNCQGTNGGSTSPQCTASLASSGGTGGTGSDPSTAINLNYNDPSTNWTTFPIGPGGTKYFKAVQASQCTSVYKQLVFDMLYQQTAPNLNFIVYKSGGSVPTAAGMYNEYVAMLAKYGYDSSTHLDGSYFFKFIGTQSGSGENAYLPSTFNQADTYYILAVNTSTSKSATFDMRYYCR